MGRHRPPVSPPVVSGYSLAGEVVMVEDSVSSLHTSVETSRAKLTRACVVTLLKVMVRSLTLGMKIPSSVFDRTRHHRRTCGFSFFKALSRSCVFLFAFIFCH